MRFSLSEDLFGLGAVAASPVRSPEHDPKMRSIKGCYNWAYDLFQSEMISLPVGLPYGRNNGNF